MSPLVPAARNRTRGAVGPPCDENDLPDTALYELTLCMLIPANRAAASAAKLSQIRRKGTGNRSPAAIGMYQEKIASIVTVQMIAS